LNTLFLLVKIKPDLMRGKTELYYGNVRESFKVRINRIVVLMNQKFFKIFNLLQVYDEIMIAKLKNSRHSITQGV
jgi:hypothetical protein